MAGHHLLDRLEKLMEESELVRSVHSCRAPAFEEDRSPAISGALRPLIDDEIAQLKANGNRCSDWGLVRVAAAFDAQRLAQCRLSGSVVLGRFEGAAEIEPGLAFPTGLYNSCIHDCTIGDNVLVKDVGMLANYVIKPGARVCNNALMVTRTGASFGNGIELPIAIETGGREVRSFAELNISVATTIASQRKDKPLLEAYNDFVDRYVSRVSSDQGVIENDATVRNTKKVLDVFVGPHATIDGAVVVENCTILNNAEERTRVADGALVKDSIIQRGCEVTSFGVVDCSVLTEHSYVHRQGLVTQSIIGPNTGIAEGEVTGSLCGPFVGFHHQALLIAAF